MLTARGCPGIVVAGAITTQGIGRRIFHLIVVVAVVGKAHTPHRCRAGIGSHTEIARGQGCQIEHGTIGKRADILIRIGINERKAHNGLLIDRYCGRSRRHRGKRMRRGRSRWHRCIRWYRCIGLGRGRRHWGKGRGRRHGRVSRGRWHRCIGWRRAIIGGRWHGGCGRRIDAAIGGQQDHAVDRFAVNAIENNTRSGLIDHIERKRAKCP